MLDPATDIVSVAFQMAGVKGWDDVVVLLKNGIRRCYQVKHTRAENDLTFGDLVRKTDGKPSLIRTLFESWREAGLNDGGTKCILYTNRVARQRWSLLSAHLISIVRELRRANKSTFVSRGRDTEQA